MPHLSWAARPYFTGQGTFDNSTVTGFLEYEHPSEKSVNKINAGIMPTLPPVMATDLLPISPRNSED